MNTRDLVLSMLKEIYAGNEFSHMLIRQVLDKYDYLDSQDKRFMKRLAEGCIERRIELDYCIEQYSSVKVNKMKPVIRCIIRSAVYQLKYMDAIPDAAVCNEAVKLARKRGFGQLRGFVNGVLRNIARELEHLQYPDEKLEPVRFLEVTYSVPAWMVEQWIKEHDEQLQCIVSHTISHPRAVMFGRAQYPTLDDYADGVDVMKFLTA